MKTNPYLGNKLRAFTLIAGALAMPAAFPVALASLPPTVITEDSGTVSGRVSAKTDTSLQVDGSTLLVTASTAYSKEGSVISLSDINAGDEVRVVTMAGAEGSVLAVTVEVTKAAE
jgi:hypothetical protein